MALFSCISGGTKKGPVYIESSANAEVYNKLAIFRLRFPYDFPSVSPNIDTNYTGNAMGRRPVKVPAGEKLQGETTMKTAFFSSPRLSKSQLWDFNCLFINKIVMNGRSY